MLNFTKKCQIVLQKSYSLLYRLCENLVFYIFANIWYCQTLKFLKTFRCELVFYFDYAVCFLDCSSSCFLVVSGSLSVNMCLRWESDHFLLHFYCCHVGLSTFSSCLGYNTSSWPSLSGFARASFVYFHTAARMIL